MRMKTIRISSNGTHAHLGVCEIPTNKEEAIMNQFCTTEEYEEEDEENEDDDVIIEN